ncbi:MAG: iron ABC transporter permease [Cellvibrionales bacterium]|nr:iron ABC transporter permease [Cellvibrionales bacterium]
MVPFLNNLSLKKRLLQRYANANQGFGWLGWLLVLLTPFVFLLGLGIGPVAIDAQQLLYLLPRLLNDALLSPLGLGNAAVHDPALSSLHIIIVEIRLPRTLLAWLVGAGLAISGAAMQGLFRNPLADPSIIGVTSGASLGASIAVVVIANGIGVGGAEQWGGLSILVMGAFIGGLLAVLIVYRLSTASSDGVTSNSTSVATMLLVGIAITALAGAGNSLLAYIADNNTMRSMSLWSMGGLDAANVLRVKLAGSIIIPAIFLLMCFSRQLDAMLLGESEAKHLGVDVQRVKWALIVIVAIAVASSVALAGVIGFVGLVVPHMLRMVIGPSHRRLLPYSALAGGLMLVMADIVARVIVSPAEMPVGVITAILGAPLFIFLLRQRRDYGMY